MKALLQSMARTLIAKLRFIFLGGEEHVFDSALAPEDFKQQIRESRVFWLDGTAGPTGHILGSSVNLTWSNGSMRRGAITTFRGHIEATPTGSRLRGRFSASRICQAYCAVWFGGVLLFFLVFIWTLLFPLFGFGLMWVGAHLITGGAEAAEQSIHASLTALAGSSVHTPKDS